MPRINARQCPFTGELFASDSLYRHHLLALREDQRGRRLWERRNAEREAFIFETTRKVTTFEELAAFLEGPFSQIFDSRHLGRKTFPRKRALMREVAFRDMRYTLLASNTHCAPKGKEVRGLQDRRGLPSGYPGWVGHISFKLMRDDCWFDLCRVLGEVGINTGTGGGRGKNRYGHMVTVFDDDIPNIAFMARFRGEINIMELKKREGIA
jgi:hypothetical protein